MHGAASELLCAGYYKMFRRGAHVPFYIRKSVSAGPFRFNFSTGGVGVSVGVKGLRIGTGPRGHYIHAGRGGLYYRATIGKAGQSRRVAPSEARSLVPSDLTFETDDVKMIEIESGDVMNMTDESFTDLLNEINSKAAQTPMSSLLMRIGIGVGLVAGLASGGAGLIFCALGGLGWIIGRWLDSYRRSTVLYYDLEGDAETSYRRLTEGFDRLLQCSAKWHIQAGGAVESLTAWKRNAGASHLVNRKPTIFGYDLPIIIKSNLTPPALHVGRQVMYFMPDVVLVQDGGCVGAVNYAQLSVRWEDSRFIETKRVPGDARIVDHTWKHPNKSGGPDRRFKDNRQIPICLYEAIHFTSSSGLNELVQVSKTGVTDGFADGVRKLAALPKDRTIAVLPTPVLKPMAEPVVELPKSACPPWGKIAASITVVLVALPLLTQLPKLGKNVNGGREPIVAVVASTHASNDSTPADPATVGTEPQKDPMPAVPVEPEARVEPPVKNASAEVANQDIPSLKQVRYTSTAVNLRDGAGTKFPVKLVVPKNAAVEIVETRGGWSRVRIESGEEGWMARATLTAR